MAGRSRSLHSSAVRPERGMQMEEIALRIVYSCLWEPDRLAFRASSQTHAQLPVRCQFTSAHCIWDARLRIQEGPCRAPVQIPCGLCTGCFKFSCHAHTFCVLLSSQSREDPWNFTRRTLCLRCQVKEGFLSAEQLTRWESTQPPFAA